MLRERIDNPRWPHKVKVTRVTPSEDPFIMKGSAGSTGSSADAVVLYEGEGRSYTDTTTTGGGTEESRVDVNKRKASIPVRFDEWAEPLLDGDTIEVAMGNVVEKGVVKDFEPDNNRTVVYWEIVRN